MPAEFPQIAEQSYVGVMISALGIYAILIPLAALVSFVVAVVLVKQGQEPFVGFAAFMIALLPLIIAIIGALQSEIHSSYALSISDNPSPNGVAEGLMNAIYYPMFGMLLTGPTYAVALLGCFSRAATRMKCNNQKIVAKD